MRAPLPADGALIELERAIGIASVGTEISHLTVFHVMEEWRILLEWARTQMHACS